MTTTTANFRARQRIRKEKAPSFCFARVRALRREILSLRETAVCVCVCVWMCVIRDDFILLSVCFAKSQPTLRVVRASAFPLPRTFFPERQRARQVRRIYILVRSLFVFFLSLSLSLSLPPCLYKPLKCESCAMPEGDNAVFCYVVTSRDLNKEVSCPWKAEVSRLLAELVS